MERKDYILNKYGLKEDRYVELKITREEMTKLFAEMGLNVGAEVGTERGVYSKCLLEANPELKLYSIDSWKTHKGYRDHVNQDKLERFYEETVERLAPFGERSEIRRGWSVEEAYRVPDESLDFVYIDANHNFQNVTNDITEWSKKVKPGGIVAGHDYVKVRSSIDCQVKAVVDAMAYAYKKYPVFIVTGNPFSSWFWIKK
jgi:hypothetical protein